jgi:hypothetical protein
VIVALVPDLMDRSKVSAAAAGRSGDVRFVASAGELVSQAAGATLVLVDLARPGVIDALGQLPAGIRVVGFGSHVDRATLAAATAAGCEAYPRSELFRRLPELLGLT